MPFLDAIVETRNADHSIILDDATAGKTIVACLCVAAQIALHSDSVAAGWVEDSYGVNNLGAGIYRLDGADNPGGDVTLRVTHNGPRALAGVALEDDITGLVGIASFEEATLGTGGTFTSQAATLASGNLVLCVFGATTLASAAAVDITAFDNGFTELGDSGWSDGGGDESARLWVASDQDVALSGTVVTATLTSSAVSWRVARGFAAYTLDSGPSTITGTAVAPLGAAAASVVGKRTANGTAVAGLGSVAASAIGTGALAVRGTISGVARTPIAY